MCFRIILFVDSQQICSLCLGEMCGNVENPLHDWNVEFPNVPKPEVVELDLPTVSQLL